MSTTALTGSNGFLGWHTKCALRESGIPISNISLGDGFNISAAKSAATSSSRLIHLAGVNRGTDDEVASGNIHLASQLAQALHTADSVPETLVFANSTQAGNGTVYGDAKRRASDLLRECSESLGIKYIDVEIPNVFGEHGRPYYNAVTSTFCHQIANKESPLVKEDRSITLAHAQDVADYLIGEAGKAEFQQNLREIQVSNLLESILEIADTYSDGSIPNLEDRFTRNLFNTFRSYLLPDGWAHKLKSNTDDRGSFVEIIRTFGGQGQGSFSTTMPGVTRGNHFHRRKIERFTVISGSAEIQMRRMFSNEILTFPVSGTTPTSVDMPTMWTHSITNIGTSELLTSFWISEVFDPNFPDTIPEKVVR